MFKRLIAAALVTFLPAGASAQVIEYYHLDVIGNVRAVTNQASPPQVVEWHDYLPFGEEWNLQPGTQPKRFTGKERDAETGLDYFGARYYGSKIGRFTTVDPVCTWKENLVDPQRWNRYAYARNNPLRFVDPDGRELRTIELARMQQIAGPAAAGISINNGRLDVSGLSSGDLINNEGALLLSQMANSQFVFTYSEGNTINTAGGTKAVDGSANLDARPDWRYGAGKGPQDMPSAGIDNAIVVDTSITRFDSATRTQAVSPAATAFHELAEGFAKLTLGIPHTFRGGVGVGAHENARLREQILIGQRPNFTQYPGGESLTR